MMNMLWNKTGLDGKWTMTVAPNKEVVAAGALPTTASALAKRGYLTMPGTVPGNFEIDLMEAGLLPDLFFGTNTMQAQTLEDRHVWYSRTFSFGGSHPERMVLYFEGIDTVADIYLNGEKIAETDNMLIPHEIAIPTVKAGENELLVHIAPVVLEARKRPLEPFVYSYLKYSPGSLTVRKAAHMFGWDIMPRIVSAGIWRSVWLVEKPAEYLEDTYTYTVAVSETEAELYTYFKAVVTGDFNREYAVRVTGDCGDSHFSDELQCWHTEGVVKTKLQNPKLWWPRDMGEPNLYTVKVELLYRGEPVDEKVYKTGIRTVDLRHTALTDAAGSGEFCFFVNGERVFIRGTNWVPLDAFHSRDAERLPKALELLWESGCNAARCWGGNVYESDDFFDFCDSHGILIWQDFAMGCATYPITEAVREDLKKEARVIIPRLRQHPSLMLWAGDNENDIAAYWETLSRDPNENLLTRQVLKEMVMRLDPARPFLPSSPFIDREAHRRQNEVPEDHLWGPRDYFKSDFYTKAVAHFASETGYHACPAPKSVEQFITKDNIMPWQDNDEWYVHATSIELAPGSADPFAHPCCTTAPYGYRIALMANQIKVLFGEQPADIERFAVASQISQSEAMKFFIERFRTAKWRRTGIIWWNLVDGWPQFSDAVVDYYYRRKLAYFTIARLQEPVCLMMQEPENGKQTLMGVNDTREEKRVTFTVTDLADKQNEWSGEATLAANAATPVLTLPEKTEPHFYVITFCYDGKTVKNHYVTGKPPYDLDQYVAWLKEAGLFQMDVD